MGENYLLKWKPESDVVFCMTLGEFLTIGTTNSMLLLSHLKKKAIWNGRFEYYFLSELNIMLRKS